MRNWVLMIPRKTFFKLCQGSVDATACVFLSPRQHYSFFSLPWWWYGFLTFPFFLPQLLDFLGWKLQQQQQQRQQHHSLRITSSLFLFLVTCSLLSLQLGTLANYIRFPENWNPRWRRRDSNASQIMQYLSFFACSFGFFTVLLFGGMQLKAKWRNCG